MTTAITHLPNKEHWLAEIKPYLDAGKRVCPDGGNKHPKCKKYTKPIYIDGTSHSWAGDKDPEYFGLKTFSDYEEFWTWMETKGMELWGFGCVQGKFSKEYTLDFDYNAKETFDRFCKESLEKLDIDIKSLYRTESGRIGGGIHWTFTTWKDGLTDEECDLHAKILAYNEENPNNDLGIAVLAKAKNPNPIKPNTNPNGKNKWLDEFVPLIEYKGDGRYIVKPPSVHKSGKLYQAVNGDAWNPSYVPTEIALKLIILAASYNEVPVEAVRHAKIKKIIDPGSSVKAAKGPVDKDSVISCYNEAHDMRQVLLDNDYVEVDAANAFWNHPGGTDYNVKLYEQDNTAFHYSPNDEIVPFGAKHPNGGVTSDPFAHLLKKHSGDKKAAVYDAAKELGMALEDRIDCIEGLDFGDPEKDFEQDTEKKTKGLKPIKWMEIFLANTNEKLIRFRRKDYRFDNGLGWIYWNEENFVAKVRRFMDVFENCKYNTRTDVVNNVIETIRSHYRLENEDIVFPVALTKNETYHAKSLPNSVSFSNGTLNYFTKEFTPMTHDIFDPNVIPYAYKPELAGTESNCIKWFRQMFDSDEAIDFLYWMLADCLLPNQANEVIWELIGEGGTGRGTLVKLISAMIGRSNYLPATLSLFQKGTDFNWANVVGMKVFCFPDIGNSVPTLITEHLKSMSGRDEQSYGAKYGKDLLRTTHSPRIVIVANRYVDFKDPGGMDRRLRIIKFVHQFTGEKEDPRFFEKKILPEIPALMASLIKHVARNFKERIPDGPFTKEELRNQELSASPTLRFIEEELCYALGESIKTSDLYSRFEAWCGENGIKKPPIKDVLCKDIKRFFGKNELWRGVENDRRRKKCILNIDWKSSTTSGVDDSYLTTKVEAKNDDFFTEKTESTVQDTSFATGVLTGVPIGVTGVPTSDFEKMLGSEFPDVTN